jgi:hypothetical protein
LIFWLREIDLIFKKNLWRLLRGIWFEIKTLCRRLTLLRKFMLMGGQLSVGNLSWFYLTFDWNVWKVISEWLKKAGRIFIILKEIIHFNHRMIIYFFCWIVNINYFCLGINLVNLWLYLTLHVLGAFFGFECSYMHLGLCKL